MHNSFKIALCKHFFVLAAPFSARACYQLLAIARVLKMRLLVDMELFFLKNLGQKTEKVLLMRLFSNFEVEPDKKVMLSKNCNSVKL